MKSIVLSTICLLAIITVSRAQSLESYGVFVNNPNNIPVDTTSKNINPHFKGGDAKLNAYIIKHLHYPKTEPVDKAEAIVNVLFTVNFDGKVTDVQILKAPNKAFADEAQRTIANLPRFTKEKKLYPDGSKVYVLPIDFNKAKNNK